MVTVPYVAGRSLRQAKNMLEVAGLGIEQIVYRPDLATNYVLEEYADGKRISEKSRVQARSGQRRHPLRRGERFRFDTRAEDRGASPPTGQKPFVGLGLNIGKISFDEGINLLNQREARVYLQTPSAGSRARLGAKVDLKATLDAAKVTAQSAAADKEMIKAAEEACAASTLKRPIRWPVFVWTVWPTVPSKRSRSSTTGFSRTKRQRKTNFSNNAHVR